MGLDARVRYTNIFRTFCVFLACCPYDYLGGSEKIAAQRGHNIINTIGLRQIRKKGHKI